MSEFKWFWFRKAHSKTRSSTFGQIILQIESDSMQSWSNFRQVVHCLTIDFFLLKATAENEVNQMIHTLNGLKSCHYTPGEQQDPSSQTCHSPLKYDIAATNIAKFFFTGAAAKDTVTWTGWNELKNWTHITKAAVSPDPLYICHHFNWGGGGGGVKKKHVF